MKNFFDVNDRTLEPSEVHRKSKEELYETAFNKDQRAILDEMSSGGGGGDEPEVWLVGNTYEDHGSVRMFGLSNVGDIDHMAELLANSDNYQVFLNGEELPFIDKGSDTVIWADGDMSASYSKDVTIIAQQSIAEFLDVSTAPTSVEVSVKAKQSGGGGNGFFHVNATCSIDENYHIVITGLDKPFSDIVTAYDEGQIPILYLAGGSVAGMSLSFMDATPQGTPPEAAGFSFISLTPQTHDPSSGKMDSLIAEYAVLTSESNTIFTLSGRFSN